MTEKWSRKYDSCIGCKTIARPHWAKGYCTICYPKYIVRNTGYFNRNNEEIYSNFIKNISEKISNTQKIRRNAKTKIFEVLDKELLKKLYHGDKMSMGDIAKRFSCSRAYILMLCRKYGVAVKTKSLARRMAYSMGKNIKCKLVNRNFFKTWSNEMAYVLGFIYADGTITRKLDTVSISQKEVEILDKIKILMQADQVIVHRKNQDLYTLSIGAKEMVEDLIKLGLTPNKSLTIKFPNMPEQYVSHFIRGYFDGDGSVGLDGRVSFVSGSNDFLESIREKLTIFASTERPMIHKHKTANAYALYYHKKAECKKIYKFFYDAYTLDKNLYLNRKHRRFVYAFDRQKISQNI